MSSSFNDYHMVAAIRRKKNVGEFFGTIVKAVKDEYVIISLMLEGHQIKLDFKSHGATHDIYEGTFVQTTFSVEIDRYDSDKFAEGKTIATHAG